MQKYKIITSADRPSDQEIEAYKDFDGLLKKHQSALRYKKLLQAGISGISVAGLIGAYLFFVPAAPPAVENEGAPIVQEAPAASLPEFPAGTAVLEELALAPESKEELAQAPRPEPEPSLSASVRGSSAQQQKASRSDLALVTPAPADEAESPEGVLAVFSKPEPAMGYKALYEHLDREKIMPADAAGVSGVVLVSFAINERGEAVDIEIEKSLHEACDAEAVRLVQEMPAWKPASVNGKPVKTRLAIPVRF
jgi:TonB family protein